MNKSKLKSYAPGARRDFIRIITERANLLGLSDKDSVRPEISGEIAVINGLPYPKRYAELQRKLAARIKTEGLSQFVEEIAYIWFNRFLAIRFMEVNGFLPQGFRVLSNTDSTKSDPEILEHATQINLPGLNKEKVLELKLAGNKDAELYRILIIAQANDLHSAMPFLFERINDETEILLPDNLLASDSIIRKLVASIDEEDWTEVEIIGWLYQFYISEKKDEVIGKTVKSEDIPAATQLFTPNWIVKYMTQNSLGRLWLEANPHSQLAAQMEFYIKSGARDKGEEVSEGGKSNDSSEFQRFDRVAEGDGIGSNSLSINEGVSERGALRSDESGSTSGSFNSVKHSGGTRTEINSGVSQFSLDSERLTGRGRNSTDDRSAAKLHNATTTQSDSEFTDRDQQNAQQFNEKSELGARDKGIGTRDEGRGFIDKLKNLPLSPNPLLLTPEEIKILDPACGSGHILVEAYELLKAIYTERGYSSRDIPLLILEKNLFGLDIDERAAQMAGFALLMKARRDDRRIFERLKTADGKQIPNIITIPDSSTLPHSAREIAEMFFSQAEQTGAAIPIRDNRVLFDEMQVQRSLMMEGETSTSASSGATEQNVEDLLSLFEQGKTLGSLIRLPPGFGEVFDKLEKAIEAKRKSGNFYEQVAVHELEPFVRAGKILANKYDCVIANPPYMGGKGMNAELKVFAAKNFPDSKSDLFAMFIEREMEHIKANGYAAFVTPFVWMFISSYEKFRSNLIEETPISSLIQLEYNAFEPAMVPVCTFILHKNANMKTKGEFIKLSDFRGHQNQAPKTLEAIKNPVCGWRYSASSDDFRKIPASPIAYSVSDKVREVFEKGTLLGEIAQPRQGLATSDNNRFLRLWFEVNNSRIGFGFTDREEAHKSKLKWFPIDKGGEFRKWYGNNEFLVNWQNDGQEMKEEIVKKYPYLNGNPDFVAKNPGFYFKSGVTWSAISSSMFSVRFTEIGHVFSNAGMKVFHHSPNVIKQITGLLNSNVIAKLVSALSETLNFDQGIISRLPAKIGEQKSEIVEESVSIARADWDSFETSWDFVSLPLLQRTTDNEQWTIQTNSVEEAWNNWRDLTEQRINRMQELETENNRLFITAYGLEDELKPEVPLEQITLARADAEKDTRRLLSYFIGCLMGRYSLDEEGLIYADAGNLAFDPSHYQTFAADDDGIVPVTDLEWFPQEAAHQFENFVRTVWGNANLSQNMRWIAAQLGGKAGETPVETVRRYFSTSFFKDHLQTYKKRPIYWLFSSGKQKAFECLVYLHRYNESTLPRMRHEYVLPLMSKLTAQIETLEELKDTAAISSEKTKLEKQIEALRKKQIELAGFDEKLRHYSDMRISLDLDDGVRVNYGKFGDLLAEVKQVATTKE